MKTSQVLSFCKTEYERSQWALIGKRLRNAVQKASLSGEDVEQNLAEKDNDGTGFLTTRDFKSFLEALSQYGKLTLQDINTICRYFARRPADGEAARDPISLREVMSFLGKEYVGNLNIRLRDAVMYTNEKSGADKIPRTIADVVRVFKRHQSGGAVLSRTAIVADIEGSLSELGVFDTLSHEQVRAVINKAQNRALQANIKFSFGSLLRFLGIDYGSDAEDETVKGKLSPRREDLTPESLLRQIIEHTTQHGLAVDEAFRHFDADGNGSISAKEFIEAFEQLKIFNDIPTWRSQIPALIAKFDTSGDGDVQLKEFFKFLGVKEYSPNIEQRMTKIFAVAIDSGMSFESIYQNFDSDGDGLMTVPELYDCLKQLGTFNEISKDDVSSCISKFSRIDSGTVSLSDFKVYFMQRVKQAQIERKDKNNRRNIRNFIELMETAQVKGLTAEKIFNHFDKDGNGSLTASELSAGLATLPQFKTMERADVENIVSFIAESSSESISLKAFGSFIAEHSRVPAKLVSPRASPRRLPEDSAVQRFVNLMDAARVKGLSPEKLFCHFDKDGSGSLTQSELSTGLRNLAQFKSLSSSDIDSILIQLDKDRNGDVSLEEFKLFLNRAKGGAGKPEAGSGSAVEKFRKLMEVSKSKGLSADKIFKHFDKDSSGSLTTAEFVSGLKKLPQFETMTTQDFVEITNALDSNGDGTVSCAELETFVSPVVSDVSAGLSSFEARVQKLFRNATAKGISLEKLFGHLDRNGDGIFDCRELENALLKTKAFNDLSEKDVRRLMDTLDRNQDGNVTFDEFKNFVLYGVTSDSDNGPKRDKSADALKRQGDTRELLLRHLRRISEPDGGIAGLLAFLDRDEDGEISVASFMKLLRREGVFDTMKEGDILDWLKPAISTTPTSEDSVANRGEEKGNGTQTESKGSPRRRERGSEGKTDENTFVNTIRVVPLMHMLDGNNPDGGSRLDADTSARAQTENEQLILRAMPEYSFSNDPEIRALEKKLRGVGHALARRGIDVEGLFRKFDNSGSGAIRRTEFLEVLSGMGMYILEKGKALEAASGVGEDHTPQARQVARVRGPGAASDQSIRAARKYVMAGGDTNRGGGVNEFQVRFMFCNICVIFNLKLAGSFGIHGARQLVPPIPETNAHPARIIPFIGCC